MSCLLRLFLLLVAAHHQANAQSWLTREERQQASQIKMTFRRPADQVPTCGTSDPGVMQMMMLPAAAFGDIMMTNVMNPIMEMFTGRNKGTERQEESERSDHSNQEEGSTSKRSWRVSPPQNRRPKSRRDWWRGLGQGEKQAENKKESRGKRAKRSVSFYSYSPWLTNNVNPSNTQIIHPLPQSLHPLPKTPLPDSLCSLPQPQPGRPPYNLKGHGIYRAGILREVRTSRLQPILCTHCQGVLMWK